jgi:hypothetical protein
MDGLRLTPYDKHEHMNEETVKHMLELAKQYHKVCLA